MRRMSSRAAAQDRGLRQGGGKRKKGGGRAMKTRSSHHLTRPADKLAIKKQLNLHTTYMHWRFLANIRSLTVS